MVLLVSLSLSLSVKQKQLKEFWNKERKNNTKRYKGSIINYASRPTYFFFVFLFLFFSTPTDSKVCLTSLSLQALATELVYGVPAQILGHLHISGFYGVWGLSVCERHGVHAGYKCETHQYVNDLIYMSDTRYNFRQLSHPQVLAIFQFVFVKQ